ncbi:MAG: cytochrome c [Acidobacteria bacterium]|nr:cytochrome c [Acidobacteriota bacterium]
MRTLMTAGRGASTAIALPLLFGLCTALGAQQGRGRGAAEPQAPAAPVKPLVPVATNTVVAHPETYYGERVTMTASVQNILSKSAFSVAQKTVGDAAKAKMSGQDVLVLAPKLQAAVTPNAYLTVFGEVVKFDPEEVAKKAKDYKLDLPADAIEKYRGKPALIATAVINESFLDLTWRMPPPATPDEEALDRLMKKIQPAFGALRGSIDGSNVDVTTQNAVALKQAFAEVEAIWKSRGKTEPMQWAADARKNAEAIETAATTGKWEAAKTAAGPLGQACGTCHTAYRERFDDGSYRIKTSK